MDNSIQSPVHGTPESNSRTSYPEGRLPNQSRSSFLGLKKDQACRLFAIAIIVILLSGGIFGAVWLYRTLRGNDDSEIHSKLEYMCGETSLLLETGLKGSSLRSGVLGPFGSFLQRAQGFNYSVFVSQFQSLAKALFVNSPVTIGHATAYFPRLVGLTSIQEYNKTSQLLEIDSESSALFNLIGVRPAGLKPVTAIGNVSYPLAAWYAPGWNMTLNIDLATVPTLRAWLDALTTEAETSPTWTLADLAFFRGKYLWLKGPGSAKKIWLLQGQPIVSLEGGRRSVSGFLVNVVDAALMASSLIQKLPVPRRIQWLVKSESCSTPPTWSSSITSTDASREAVTTSPLLELPFNGGCSYASLVDVNNSPDGDSTHWSQEASLSPLFGDTGWYSYCTPSVSAIQTGAPYLPWLVLLLVLVVLVTFSALVFGLLLHSLWRNSRSIELEGWLGQLSEAKQRAEEADTSKTNFLAYLCHELRNPLHAIVGNADLLADSRCVRQDADSREYIRAILASSNLMIAIVNDALDMSKINAGKLMLEPLIINIRYLLDSTLRDHKAKADSKNVALVLNVDDRIPLYLVVDPTRLRQIVHNLIGNALKFTEQGAVTVSAFHLPSPDTASPDMVLRIVVEDTGVGIQPERLSDVFSPYMQATSSTARVFGGTGLGLAIVKGITLSMKGSVKVASEVGVGTAFTVDLPVQTGPENAQPSSFGPDLASPPGSLGSILIGADQSIQTSPQAPLQAQLHSHASPPAFSTAYAPSLSSRRGSISSTGTEGSRGSAGAGSGGGRWGPSAGSGIVIHVTDDELVSNMGLELGSSSQLPSRRHSTFTTTTSPAARSPTSIFRRGSLPTAQVPHLSSASGSARRTSVGDPSQTSSAATLPGQHHSSSDVSSSSHSNSNSNSGSGSPVMPMRSAYGARTLGGASPKVSSVELTAHGSRSWPRTPPAPFSTISAGAMKTTVIAHAISTSVSDPVDPLSARSRTRPLGRMGDLSPPSMRKQLHIQIPSGPAVPGAPSPSGRISPLTIPSLSFAGPSPSPLALTPISSTGPLSPFHAVDQQSSQPAQPILPTGSPTTSAVAAPAPASSLAALPANVLSTSPVTAPVSPQSSAIGPAATAAFSTGEDVSSSDLPALSKPFTPMTMPASGAVAAPPVHAPPATETAATNPSETLVPELKLQPAPAAPKFIAHCLVVEDEVTNQKLMRRMLERLNLRVTIAENGLVAANKFPRRDPNAALAGERESEFDLVFMDLSMPVLDGCSASMRIREAGYTRVPIVAVSGNVLNEERAKCVQAGMNDFLPKPARVKAIEEALRRWVPAMAGTSST